MKAQLLIMTAAILLSACSSEADKERPWTETEERLGAIGIRVMSALNTWVYRFSDGKYGSEFPSGAPILLLTTTGRKSGEPRTAPLLYLRDGEDYIIVASKGGMSRHPQWYLNLQAQPRCEVQVGKETFRVTAAAVDEEEKKELWPRLVAMYPDYDVYQKRTARQIPVVRLTRSAEGVAPS
jgi:deazaflavin-dependent oxidoreductase (nitroreductase family)